MKSAAGDFESLNQPSLGLKPRKTRVERMNLIKTMFFIFLLLNIKKIFYFAK
jgi:hypothetical protein